MLSLSLFPANSIHFNEYARIISFPTTWSLFCVNNLCAFLPLIHVVPTAVQTHWPSISNTSRCQPCNYETFIELAGKQKMPCTKSGASARIRISNHCDHITLHKIFIVFCHQSLTHAEWVGFNHLAGMLLTIFASHSILLSAKRARASESESIRPHK